VARVVIETEQLGKRYKLGTTTERYETIRSALGRALTSRLRPRVGARDGASSPDHVWALRDVNVTVTEGEATALIGRNGSGKTTLLKILSRITEPTRGWAEVEGRVGSLLEVGAGVHPELTGRENIYLAGAVLGMRRSEIRRKFDEIVGFAEVDTFLDTPMKRYSSGMYVRLAFSVAAHLEPDILLVDEVLAVGDAAFQRKCLGKMGDVAAGGRTVLFVSHNMALVQALCTRGIVLDGGTVTVDGPVSDAAAAYLATLEQLSAVELVERRDRRGRGDVRIVRIEIEGDEAAALTTGSGARFVFVLSEARAGTSCFFTVYNNLGQPIANFNSDVRSPADLREPGTTRFVCEIDELPLVPGRYRVNAAVRAEGDLQDLVEGAAFFEVIAGSLDGRPVLRDSGYGSVAIGHRWTTS
jgi:lipopolysaccharide transport system ATP-binding protein